MPNINTQNWTGADMAAFIHERWSTQIAAARTLNVSEALISLVLTGQRPVSRLLGAKLEAFWLREQMAAIEKAA